MWPWKNSIDEDPAHFCAGSFFTPCLFLKMGYNGGEKEGDIIEIS